MATVSPESRRRTSKSSSRGSDRGAFGFLGCTRAMEGRVVCCRSRQSWAIDHQSSKTEDGHTGCRLTRRIVCPAGYRRRRTGQALSASAGSPVPAVAGDAVSCLEGTVNALRRPVRDQSERDRRRAGSCRGSPCRELPSSHPCWSCPELGFGPVSQRPSQMRWLTLGGPWIASIGPAARCRTLLPKPSPGGAEEDGGDRTLVLLRRAGLPSGPFDRLPPRISTLPPGLEEKGLRPSWHPRDWPEIRSVTRAWTLCAPC
jgi:hypothetical protein